MVRKLAREGALPPVLLLHNNSLDSYLLLDGHDRLLAACLEGVTPTYFAVTQLRKVSGATREQHEDAVLEALMRQLTRADGSAPTQRTVDAVNRRLVQMYSDEVEPMPRVRCLRGGVQAWAHSLQSECLGLARASQSELERTLLSLLEP